MCMAAELSQRLGWLTDSEKKRIVALIKRANLPIAPPTSLSPERFKELMSVDKKVLDGDLRLVLLKGIGKSLVTGDFNHDDLNTTLKEYGTAN